MVVCEARAGINDSCSSLRTWDILWFYVGLPHLPAPAEVLPQLSQLTLSMSIVMAQPHAAPCLFSVPLAKPYQGWRNPFTVTAALLQSSTIIYFEMLQIIFGIPNLPPPPHLSAVLTFHSVLIFQGIHFAVLTIWDINFQFPVYRKRLLNTPQEDSTEQEPFLWIWPKFAVYNWVHSEYTSESSSVLVINSSHLWGSRFLLLWKNEILWVFFSFSVTMGKNWEAILELTAFCEADLDS